jgi:hypothetical protein
MHAFGLSVAIPKSVFPGHYFTTRNTLDSILCRTPAYLTNMRRGIALDSGRIRR